MRVVARRRQGYTHEVEIDSGHTIVIDEPADRGGADLGPSPTRAAAAGLAACTAITCEMYGAHKGWELAAVECEVEIAQGEPGPAHTERGEFGAHSLRLARPSPAAHLVVRAGERVHDRVEVGAHLQAGEPLVANDRHDDGELVLGAEESGELVDEGGAVGAGNDRDAHTQVSLARNGVRSAR